MSTTPQVRAAAYVRQSADVGEGIAQQIARCRALIKARGWVLVEIFEDNDTSATKARGPKTAWARMISAARSKGLDVVVSVDVDRLLRGLPDLLAIMETGAKVCTVDGEIDLSTADGEFRATMLTAMARFEIRRKTERALRYSDARRAQGIPSAGRVPFGYAWVKAADRGTSALPWAVDKDDAAELRRAHELLAAGRPLGSIATTLNREGSARTWRANTVRRVLLNPFPAGLLPPKQSAQNRAEGIDPAECTEGAWEPIVSPEAYATARDVLLRPERRTQTGTARKHLLGGLALCGICQAPVRSGVTREGYRSYRCPSQAHFQRRADLIDAVTEQSVIRHLFAVQARTVTAEAEDHAEDRAQRSAILGRLRSLADLLADGTLDAAGVRTAKAKLTEQLSEIEARLSLDTRRDALEQVRHVSDVRAYWHSLDLGAKRALIASLGTIEIQSPGRGVRATEDRPFLTLTWTRDVADPAPTPGLPVTACSEVLGLLATLPTAQLPASALELLTPGLRPDRGRVDTEAVAQARRTAEKRWVALSLTRRRALYEELSGIQK